MISAICPARAARLFVLMMQPLCFVGWESGELLSQQKAHYLFDARQPVGEIGRMQLARRPDLRGVYQPVLLKVPTGAEISLAEGSGFPIATKDAALVSLQVGETYRLKVANIPNRYGDVYPTVELLDRMHAPAGKETRYPVPIELTAEDLRWALTGTYVTRVIYVEDPRRALPIRDLPQQRYLDALPQEDPLQVAGSLGRPVAILRMGTLAPESSGPSESFLFGSPPFQRHEFVSPLPYKPSELKPTDLPPQPVPRDPEPEVPAAQDDAVDPQKGDASDATAPADTPEQAAPAVQPDDATSDPDPFELPDTADPDDTGDIFDEPIDTPEDDLGDDDPFADDI